MDSIPPIWQQLNLDKHISESKRECLPEMWNIKYPIIRQQPAGGVSYFMCSQNTVIFSKWYKDFRMHVQKRIRFVGSPAEVYNSKYTF